MRLQSPAADGVALWFGSFARERVNLVDVILTRARAKSTPRCSDSLGAYMFQYLSGYSDTTTQVHAPYGKCSCPRVVFHGTSLNCWTDPRRGNGRDPF